MYSGNILWEWQKFSGSNFLLEKITSYTVMGSKSCLLINVPCFRSVVDVCGGCGWYPPLFPSRVDLILASNEMEVQLRTLTEQHREVSCTVLCMSQRGELYVQISDWPMRGEYFTLLKWWYNCSCFSLVGYQIWIYVQFVKQPAKHCIVCSACWSNVMVRLTPVYTCWSRRDSDKDEITQFELVGVC